MRLWLHILLYSLQWACMSEFSYDHLKSQSSYPEIYSPS